MGDQGKADQDRDPGAGAVPEGHAVAQETGQDPVFGDELSTFPPSRRSAGTLDLAAANDEPTQLIRYLIAAANENLTETEHMGEWQVLLRNFNTAALELQKMQAPGRKR